VVLNFNDARASYIKVMNPSYYEDLLKDPTFSQKDIEDQLEETEMAHRLYASDDPLIPYLAPIVEGDLSTGFCIKFAEVDHERVKRLVLHGVIRYNCIALHNLERLVCSFPCEVPITDRDKLNDLCKLIGPPIESLADSLEERTKIACYLYDVMKSKQNK